MSFALHCILLSKKSVFLAQTNAQKSATHDKFIFSLHMLLSSIVNNGRIKFFFSQSYKGAPVQLSVIC